jgi:hypothetical protein
MQSADAGPTPVNLTAQPLASSSPTSAELGALLKTNPLIKYVIVRDDAGVWRFNRVKTTVDKLQDTTTWWMEPVPVEADASLSPEVAEIQSILATTSPEELLDSHSSANARIETLINVYASQNKRRTLVQEFFTSEASFIHSTKEFVEHVNQLPKQENISIFMQPYQILAQKEFLSPATEVNPAVTSLDDYTLLKAQALINEFVTQQDDGTIVMTAAFEERLKVLTDTVTMYANFSTVFGEGSGNNINENEQKTLQSYAIMTTQRVTRYDLLAQEISRELSKIQPSSPEMQKIKEKTLAKFKSIGQFTLRANEIRRQTESLQKLLATQAVLGKMAHDGLMLSAQVTHFNPEQKKIWDDFLAQVTEISNQIVKDNIYFSLKQDDKVIQAADKFYEVFINALAAASLAQRGSANTGLYPTMLQYLKSIDKKLQAEGLPGIVLKKVSFAFSPTSKQVFSTLEKADEETIKRIVMNLYNTVKTAQENYAGDEIVKNAVAIVKLMGPKATAIWQQQEPGKSSILNMYDDVESKRRSLSDDEQQDGSDLLISTYPAEGIPHAESSELINLDILGKIAEELKAKRMIAAQYGFTQLQIWDNFSKKVQEVSKSVVESGELIKPEQFYATFMQTFIDGYILHEKTQNDVFSECVRGFIITVDKYFHQHNLQGVVYPTLADIPGTSNKDAPALQSLNARNKNDLQKMMVADLFKNLKTLVESPVHGEYEARVFNRTLDVINAMGSKAVMLWNLHANQEFFELSLPNTKTYSDLFQLGRTETERRQKLLNIVTTEFTALRQANDNLPASERIPEELIKAINQQLEQALAKSQSRSDLNENIKLAVLKLFSEGYLLGRIQGIVSSQSKALQLIDQFIVRTETSLTNNKQKGIFVDNPQELTPYTLIGNYTLADAVFAETKKLSVPNFNLYMETLFNDVQSKMDRHDAQKILVNAIKLLEKTGRAAKEKWNELAALADTPLARRISLPDVRIEWTEKKAEILAEGQLEGSSLVAGKKLRKLLEEEHRKLGMVVNGPSFFHHSAPVAPASPEVTHEPERPVTPPPLPKKPVKSEPAPPLPAIPPARPVSANDQLAQPVPTPIPERPLTPPPLPKKPVIKARSDDDAPPIPPRPVTPPLPAKKPAVPPLPAKKPDIKNPKEGVAAVPPLPAKKPDIKNKKAEVAAPPLPTKSPKQTVTPPPLPKTMPTKKEPAKAPPLPKTAPPEFLLSPKKRKSPPPLPSEPPAASSKRGRKPSS